MIRIELLEDQSLECRWVLDIDFSMQFGVPIYMGVFETYEKAVEKVLEWCSVHF